MERWLSDWVAACLGGFYEGISEKVFELFLSSSMFHSLLSTSCYSDLDMLIAYNTFRDGRWSWTVDREEHDTGSRFFWVLSSSNVHLNAFVWEPTHLDTSVYERNPTEEQTIGNSPHVKHFSASEIFTGTTFSESCQIIVLGAQPESI